MPSLRDALEAALAEDPDDLATHRAYADYLQEQGDPRGEFIQIQLALEDPERTKEERRELERRERGLLAEHSRQWLGILADELLGPVDEPWELFDKSDRPYEINFARGWLNRIVRFATNERFSDLGRLLSRAPESRLLHELILEYDEGVVEQLVDSSFLGNLRVFQFGVRKGSFDYDLHEHETTWRWTLSDFVEKLPRIEELYLSMGTYAVRLVALTNLRNLRVLQIHRMMTLYPLDVLADNPALGNLTHLLLYPGGTPRPLIDLAGIRAVIQSPYLQSLTHLQLRRSDLGDVGCTELVTSGILKRLKVLDLRHGEITDAGARILADCPDLRHLEHLDIDRNGLTQVGIDVLRRVLGEKLRADDQQNAEELAQRRYLDEGDFD